MLTSSLLLSSAAVATHLAAKPLGGMLAQQAARSVLDWRAKPLSSSHSKSSSTYASRTSKMRTAAARQGGQAWRECWHGLTSRAI